MISTAPWWAAAFGPDYEAVYAHRSDADADAEIAGIFSGLGDGPIADACCGNGRHLAALRRRGKIALGFDFSADLLRSAAMRPAAAGCMARADVRAIPFAANSFSAVLVLFTAFGYFDEADNAKTLAGLARLLTVGGSLILDLPEPQRLRAGLIEHSQRTSGGLHIDERRRLEGKRVIKEVRITRSDGSTHAYTESVRLYDAAEMTRLATAAGLEVRACWPSLRGPTIDEDRQVWWLGG